MAGEFVRKRGRETATPVPIALPGTAPSWKMRGPRGPLLEFRTMPTRRELANAIRVLAMDAVQQANSGHPGAPMGMADIAEVLWRDLLKHNPANPAWWDRDRFVLSNGHASMLLYALLHLTGYRCRHGRAAQLPPARQPHRRPSRARRRDGHRDHHRPAGAGHRQCRRAWRWRRSCWPPSSIVPASTSSITAPGCSVATAA